MRPDLEILEKIDAYLSGTMDGREKELFEQQLLSDPQLASWTETQRALRKAMDNLHLKHQAMQAYRSYKLWKGIKITGLVLGSVLACALVYYGVKKFTSGTHHRENAEVNIVIPDCEGKENCFTPENMIPSQYLDINTDADTVVVGNQGLVLVIPAHAFTDENGNPVSGHVQLELKEALDPATIMLSGLSTVSGSDPLETGGMFYLDARQNGKKLRISNEGILAHVPALEQKPGMMLYDGERKPDGSINWTNPKPVENFLLARDMNTLDFYPPGYVDKLQELGLNYESKHFRDSLYLSFEYEGMMNVPTDTFMGDSMVTTDQGYFWAGEGGRIYDAMVQDTLNEITPRMRLSGEQLFKMNCARCHSTTSGNMAGPGLKDVRKRWKREADLIHFVQNSSRFLATGDAYANKIFREYSSSPMPSFESLTDQDVRNILDYVENANSRIPYDIHLVGVSPSRVLGFWNDKFSQTYLATREFEQRMPFIHTSCNNSVLDIYVENIRQPLYKCDSIAYELTGNPQFLEFAALRQGNVEAHNVKYSQLQKFYERQSALYKEAGMTTTRKFFEKHRELDQQATLRQWKQAAREDTHYDKALQEEFNLNYDEAVRQLKTQKKIQVDNPNLLTGYTATVTTTGWKNFDRKLMESVVKGETFRYTNEGGDSAVIRYADMTVSIANYTRYDQLMVYLVPAQLSTYLRLDGASGTYTRGLNELLTYDLVAIGYAKKQLYLYVQRQIAPANYADVELQPLDLTEACEQLARINNFTALGDIRDAMDYAQFVAEDNERKDYLRMAEAMREELWPVVYPCGGTTVENATDSTSAMH